MKDYPFTTLFMLSSVDGKISTGITDKRDFDRDFPKINGLKEGLHQYYDLEKRTDIFSFNTGRVMAKVGVNSDKSPINAQSCSFIIIDNQHLSKKGVQNLINGTKKLYLVTSNKEHPVFNLSKNKKLEIIFYPKKVNFKDLFKRLRQKWGVKRITIQSGGTLNSRLIKEKLIDMISIVIAPCLIGGKDTSTIVDGKSLISKENLKNIRILKLVKVEKLKNSYLHLKYKVVN